MFDTQKVKSAFSAAAGDYDEHAGLQQDVLAECMELAKDCWDNKANILDVGAGTGTLAQAAKKEKLDWRVVSLDLSFDMCAVARADGFSAINANTEYLPFADSSFDGVFSSLMLQWANKPLEVFKEWQRVTKPGGRCILSTFIHGTLDELRKSFEALDKNQHVNDFGPPNYFSALAVHAGFRVLSSEEVLITEYYPDVISIMRGMKSIGATTKQSGKYSKGMMTPRQLKTLEHEYRKKFAHADGLPATWHVMYMLLEKP